MKTPAPRGAIPPQPVEAMRAVPAVQLRALSDIHPLPPAELGRLAPPLDPSESRSRKLRDLVTWGAVAVLVACGVSLVVWFVAR